ncbi:MAG: hypothetical protein WCK77_20635, partial [Verrucomicrobiota bacterium]
PEDDPDASGNKPPKENDEPADANPGPKPDESPEQRARRILAENADLEKGPRRSGHFEFNNPEQDW